MPAELPLGKKLALAVATTVTFFVVVELALTVLGVKPVRQIRDPFVGFRPGVSLFARDGDDYVTDPRKLAFFNFQTFPVHKEKSSLRAFCIGGSTTYGRPYDSRTAYPAFLEAYLEEADPAIDWQIINAGGISYASYRLALLMEELRQYTPDLVIVYTGHNEFLEERSYSEVRDWSSSFSTAVGLASRSRLYSFMQAAREAIVSPPAPSVQMAREVTTILERDGPETYHRDLQLRERVLDHYRFSLERIVTMAEESGARVILVNPASNLKDFGPFKSESSVLSASTLERWNELFEEGRRELAEGNPDEALSALEQAESLDPHHAENLYLLGRALLEKGRPEEAYSYFVRAKDEDIAPLRALSEIEVIVSEVAAGHGIHLVDYPEILRLHNRSEHGQEILGSELFLDHLHPNIEAHAELAKALYEVVGDLGLSEGGPLPEEIEKRVASRAERLMGPADMGRALHNLAVTLGWAGKTSEALTASEGALELLPEDSEILATNGHLLAKLGREDEALELYLAAVKLNPENGVALARLGDHYGRVGRYEEARKFLQRAIDQTQVHWPAGFRSLLHVRLGRAYQQLGDPTAARQAFEQALGIEPSSEEARRRLAQMSASSH